MDGGCNCALIRAKHLTKFNNNKENSDAYT